MWEACSSVGSVPEFFLPPSTSLQSQECLKLSPDLHLALISHYVEIGSWKLWLPETLNVC
jgi:hypothetical protein